MRSSILLAHLCKAGLKCLSERHIDRNEELLVETWGPCLLSLTRMTCPVTVRSASSVSNVPDLPSELYISHLQTLDRQIWLPEPWD